MILINQVIKFGYPNVLKSYPKASDCIHYKGNQFHIFLLDWCEWCQPILWGICCFSRSDTVKKLISFLEMLALHVNKPENVSKFAWSDCKWSIQFKSGRTGQSIYWYDFCTGLEGFQIFSRLWQILNSKVENVYRNVISAHW